MPFVWEVDYLSRYDQGDEDGEFAPIFRSRSATSSLWGFWQEHELRLEHGF